MEKTVNTAWYAKKCALGTLVCCGTQLVLLMLASALILRGAISEEMANGAVLVCAAVAAFLGCMIGARKTSKRAMMTAGCAASAWVDTGAVTRAGGGDGGRRGGAAPTTKKREKGERRQGTRSPQAQVNIKQ